MFIIILILLVGCAQSRIKGNAVSAKLDKPKIQSDESIQPIYYMLTLQKSQDNAVSKLDKFMADDEISETGKKISEAVLNLGFNDVIVKYFIEQNNQYFLVALPYNVSAEEAYKLNINLDPDPQSIMSELLSTLNYPNKDFRGIPFDTTFVITKANFPWIPEFINADMESFRSNSKYHYQIVISNNKLNFYIVQAKSDEELESILHQLGIFDRQSDDALIVKFSG